MKRYNQDAQGSRGEYLPPQDPFWKEYPEVARYCSDCQWDDGKPRDPCSVTFRIGADNAHVSLNDNELGGSITSTGKTVKDALRALEAYVSGPNPTWRIWKKKR